MNKWILAPSLSTLRTEVNTKWPNRSKSSDGTIGDSAHASRKSDHNPNSRNVVCAIDITAMGINVEEFLYMLRGDDRVAYYIYKAKLYSRKNNWLPTPSSGHATWIHVSILNGVTSSYPYAQQLWAENNTQPWFTKENKDKEMNENDLNAIRKIVKEEVVAGIKSEVPRIVRSILWEKVQTDIEGIPLPARAPMGDVSIRQALITAAGDSARALEIVERIDEHMGRLQ